LADFGIRFDDKGLQRDLKRFGERGNKAVRMAMEQSLQMIADEAKRNTPVDMGRLMSSIGTTTKEGIYEVKGLGVDVVGRVGSRVIYAPYVEMGRKPGATMPPVWAIEEWARRHGMAGLGFVIARAIGRRGIKGRHMLENAAKNKAEQVVKVFRNAIDRLLRGLHL